VRRCANAAPERCVPLGERYEQVNAFKVTKSHQPAQNYIVHRAEFGLPEWSGMITGRGIIMRAFFIFSATLPVVASLGGCAGSSDRFPSLALRDFETRPVGAVAQSGLIDAPRPAPAPDSSLIAAIVSAAEVSFEKFASQQPTVSRLVIGARGQNVESTVRARALVALADLTSLRSSTELHLADLDLLMTDAKTGFAPSDEVSAARALVLDLVTREDAMLDDLWAEMER
jgi:hypothetical protein